MNSPITFPPPEPALKIVRPSAEKWAATLLEERRRLQEDQEALREREENLHSYEARLRALQAEIETGRTSATIGVSRSPRVRTAPAVSIRASHAPFHEDAALQSAWEKLHRAREILEAEQKNLRDDRIALREQEAFIQDREAAVAAREEQVAAREALVVAATPHGKAGEQTSAVSRITRAPFDLARSVFGGRK